MPASRTLILCWLGLALLSVASVQLGSSGATLSLAVAVLLAALGKAWLITDGFMELRHAPRLWRGLLLAWPLTMALGVLLALRFSLELGIGARAQVVRSPGRAQRRPGKGALGIAVLNPGYKLRSAPTYPSPRICKWRTSLRHVLPTAS